MNYATTPSDIMDISIIIPVLNEEKRISKCLDSISKQNFKGIYEIIIVNNGCSDNTIEIIKSYENDAIKIINDFGHLGGARQTGVEAAQAPYIAFIDADEIADFNWLSELYNFRNKYDAVLGSLNGIPFKNSKINKYFIDMLELSIKISPNIFKGITFGSGNVLIDRKKALEVGFDCSLPTAEDGDFSYRFIKRGFDIYYNPNAMVYHPMPSDLYSYIRYQDKLAHGWVLLIKKYKKLDLLYVYLASMIYPISPIFLVRTIRMGKRIEYLDFILGLFNALVYMLNLIRLFVPQTQQKIIRPK
jgi:glycosyltransferase involved in cell wall biosynthesis